MKYDNVLLSTAKLFSELSTCRRLKVGAVIAKDGRPLVAGYNGTISGLDNCCEEQTEKVCPECEGEGFLETEGIGIFDCQNCFGSGFEMRTKDTVVHAEQNAIFYAAKLGIPLEGTDIYVTHAPCEQCSKAIASAGIKRVVYENKYRNQAGIDFLEMCDVLVETIK